MKAYISASTERTEENKELYKKILVVLDEYNIENENPYFSGIIENQIKIPLPKDLYDVALKSVSNSDLLILDISDQSISLGILIEYARNNNIPVLCICDIKHVDKIPRILIYKRNSHLFSIIKYKENTIEPDLRHYLDNFKKNKIKFNVFITPEIDSYMKWGAKKKNLSSKSDFFRNLIEDQMKEDPEYTK